MTVRAAADSDTPEVDDTATLAHTITATTNSDTGYGSISADLTVNVRERSIILNPSAALSLNEDGAAASYTVALSSQPTGTVAVAVASANADLEFSTDQQDYSASPSLSFDGASWNTPRTVYVRAKHDDDHQDETATITHTPSGGGYSATDAPDSRNVSIADDDLRLLRSGLGANGKLAVPEGGAAGFTVRLGSIPGGAVTVASPWPTGAARTSPWTPPPAA